MFYYDNTLNGKMLPSFLKWQWQNSFPTNDRKIEKENGKLTIIFFNKVILCNLDYDGFRTHVFSTYINIFLLMNTSEKNVKNGEMTNFIFYSQIIIKYIIFLNKK